MKLGYLLILIVGFMLVSCSKSFEEFSTTTPATGTDTVWSVTNLSSLPINELHQSLQLSTMADSFTINTGATILFANNTKVEIPPAVFTSNGTAVDGRAKIELLLLKKKGDLIRFRRPTTSNGYLLQSGGVLFINVTKNGQALQLKSNRYIGVSFEDLNSTSQMRGFYGVPANTLSFETFNWLPIQDSSLDVFATQTGYRINTNRLQWINCDFFSDTAAQKSRTVLSMPRDFTNANTSAFIVFKNINAIMQFNADALNRIWKTEKVPVGKEVLYVTVTKIGNDYWLGTANATTALLQNIHIVPEKKTLQVISTFLDGL